MANNHNKNELECKIDLMSIAKSENFIDFKIKINEIKDNMLKNNTNVLNVKISGVKSDNSFSESSIIVKFTHRHISKDKSFENETIAYNIIFPALQKLQENVEMDSDERFKVPRYLKNTYDDEQKYLVIENVRSLGYENADCVQSLDFDHLRLVIRKLANFHGTIFALKIFDRNSYNSIVGQNLKDPGNGSKINIYQKLIDCLNRTKTYLNHPGQIDVLDRIIKDLPIKQDVALNSAPKANDVICHGDFRNGNFRFKYNKDKIPVDVCFLNWQLLNYGSLFIDLHYMMYLSLDAKTRNKNYSGVFDWYYSDLGHVLESLDLDIDKIYPKEEFQADERTFSRHALALAVSLTYNNSEDSWNAAKLASIINNENIVKNDSVELSDEEQQSLNNIIEDFIFYE